MPCRIKYVKNLTKFGFKGTMLNEKYVHSFKQRNSQRKKSSEKQPTPFDTNI